VAGCSTPKVYDRGKRIRRVPDGPEISAMPDGRGQTEPIYLRETAVAGSVDPSAWIIEDYASGLITRFQNVSAWEAASGRTETMRVNTKHIARDSDAEVDVTQKGQPYTLDTENGDTIQLDAAKLTHASSYDEEDRADAAAWQDITDRKKANATSNLAILYDNLALGVTGAQVIGSKTAPYISAYHDVATNAASHIITMSAAAFATNSKALNDALSDVQDIVEDSAWASEGLVWIMSHAFKKYLRAMDATGKNGMNWYVPPMGGDPNVAGRQPIQRGVIGGTPAYFTRGARLTAAGTYTPPTGIGAKGSLGNAIGLLVPAEQVIKGNRSPLESQFLDSLNGNGGIGALTDTDYLKMRTRKAARLGQPEAAAILELIT
jgi:hypothetical protein